MPEKTKKRPGGRGHKLAWAVVDQCGRIDVESVRLKKLDCEPCDYMGEKVKRVEVRVMP